MLSEKVGRMMNVRADCDEKGRTAGYWDLDSALDSGLLVLRTKFLFWES
jgi:hypothetical protein